MFKRARWTSVGFAAGVGASVWTSRRVRRAAQRLVPGTLAGDVRDRVAESAQGAGRRVREAWQDGRDAMAVREAELRDRLEARGSSPAETATGSGRRSH
jgi:hypothetical protein